MNFNVCSFGLFAPAGSFFTVSTSLTWRSSSGLLLLRAKIALYVIPFRIFALRIFTAYLFIYFCLSVLCLSCFHIIFKNKRLIMAKFLSTVYSGIRGSVGGLTYTANQFHQLIVRQKTSPVNPNTTRQSQIRSAFSGAVALWAGLSAAFRNAWNDYADTLVFQGPLGPYTVPGRDVFIANISVALYLQSVNGVPAVVDTTPPGIAGFLNISSVAPADFTPAASTGISFSFIQSGAEDVIAYATRSVAFGLSRERFKGPFLSSTNEYLEVVAPGSGVVDFDGLIVDLKYFMRVRFITALAPFRLSAEFIVSSVAVTNV